jgi:glycosyltransferase involved in cell wall biosynthesis
MKVLFFVSSLHAGGAERVASTLSSAWAQRGDAVTLVPTFTGKGHQFYPLDPAVRVVWLADRLGRLGRRFLPSIMKLFAIRRLIRETRPDVIVSFLTNVNVVVLLATRGMGVPIIVCERTNPAVSTNVGKLLKRLRAFTYRWADIVCLQSEDTVPAFRKMLPGLREVAVIPNPLPPALFEPMADPVADAVPVAVPDPGAGVTPARRRIMAMGRLVPIKGFERLIQAFAALSGDFPDWDLHIWGDGPLRPTLTQQIQEAGLAHRIFLPGRTDQPWAELAGADIFALTSLVEGFPNALLEAMALGRACVTVDCPSGPREISQDGEVALLVPAGDAPALGHALAQLMGDSVLRDVLGRHAAASVRARYGLPDVLAQWDALIERARQGGRQKEAS